MRKSTLVTIYPHSYLNRHINCHTVLYTHQLTMDIIHVLQYIHYINLLSAHRPPAQYTHLSRIYNYYNHRATLQVSIE